MRPTPHHLSPPSHAATIRNADKIVVLNEGEVVEQGTHDELVGRSGSLYATLVSMQESASQGSVMGAVNSFFGSGGPSAAADETVEEEEEEEAGQEAKAADEAGGETDALKGAATEGDEDAVSADVETGPAPNGTTDAKEAKGDELNEDEQAKYNAGAVTSWIWGLTKPERVYLGFGLVGSLLIGCGFPLRELGKCGIGSHG